MPTMAPSQAPTQLPTATKTPPPETAPSGGAVCLPGSPITLDSEDAGKNAAVTVKGDWEQRTCDSCVAQGINFLMTTSDGASVLFAPEFALSGRYDVYLSFTTSASRATNVVVEVQHGPENGMLTALTLDQRNIDIADIGGWRRIGAFEFSAGRGGSVRILADNPDGKVIADAVQFRCDNALGGDAARR